MAEIMKQAVILAAGEGQRLRPFTVNRPKAMLSLAGRPLLDHVVAALVAGGIRDIVIVVGYRKEPILDYLGSGERYGAHITYITQEKQLGTAQALKLAEAAVGDDFLVLPGDNLIESGTLSDISAAAAPTVLAKRVADPSRYGVLLTTAGRVKSIAEKPPDAPSNTVSTGIYKFNHDIFARIGEELAIPDVLNKMIADAATVNFIKTEATWLDIVYPWDILTLNEFVLNRLAPSTGGTVHPGVTLKGTVSVGPGSVIHPGSYISGPAIIGRNCEIGPGICIFGATSIGDNTVIRPFSEVNNCVIGPDCRLGSGSIIQDSVIDQGCTVGERFMATSGGTAVALNGHHHQVSAGAMIGADCRIEAGVIARPGTIIGNGSQVQAMKLIHGRLPDGSLVY